jgi:hypothetical protein
MWFGRVFVACAVQILLMHALADGVNAAPPAVPLGAQGANSMVFDSAGAALSDAPADPVMDRGRAHGEFLMGARFLRDTWSPYENQVVLGGAGGVAGRRMPVGIDGGFVICFGGYGGPYGPNRHSFVGELFVGAGKSWTSEVGGRFAYIGAGPSLVYGEFRAPHSGDPDSDTSLGVYARAGCGFLRVSKTRLGIEARYSYGARLSLQSAQRSADGLLITLVIGRGH